MTTSFKQTAALWVLFIAFTTALYSYFFLFGKHSPDIGKVSVGEPAPEIELTTLNGKKAKLSDFKGKVVFLNFWATWCAPCRQELSDIQSLYQKMVEKPFTIVAISVDSTGPEKVTEFLGERGITFPVFHDPNTISAKQFGVTGYPETFILNKQGVVAKMYVGPRVWTSRSIVDSFEKIIKE